MDSAAHCLRSAPCASFDLHSPMRWTQVDIEGPLALEEVAIACLAGTGCSNVQVIRDEDLPVYDDAWAPEPSQPGRFSHPGAAPRVIVRGYLPEGRDPSSKIESAIRRSGLDPGGDSVRIAVSGIEDPGWERSWRKYHRPTRIGRRFVITPTWAKPRPHRDDILLTIDPGMAFGTGQHGTTRLCLRAVEDYMKPGWRVIDVGCGSGILSIAAAKMGAAVVHAYDTDCLAIATSTENITINHCERTIRLVEGALSAPYPAADMVIANILAGVVIHLAPGARQCLAAGGNPEAVFIASGITRPQEPEVEESFRRHGLELIRCTRSGEWSCMAARAVRGA